MIGEFMCLFLLSCLPASVGRQDNRYEYDYSTGLEVMDIKGWPTVFELNIGETYIVRRKDVRKRVKLLSFEEFFQPYSKVNGEIFEKAIVDVEVDGIAATLVCRPYEMPVDVNGLRLYVEVTRNWANDAQTGKMPEVERQVRFSAVLAGESWGPEGNVFPIQDYRFHSSSYNNTWNQHVPYSIKYYHRGDDYGAIPDILSVVASYDGIMSYVGDGSESNPFYITYEGGIKNRLSHMNIYTCDTSLTVGDKVSKGQFIGKTGSTYLGQTGKQVSDHHLHYSFEYGNTTISTYPILIQGYFNSYPDALLAVAGGIQYTKVGRIAELDGSRSVARPGRKIVSSYWVLHDGTRVDDTKTSIIYEKAGLYSEELVVEADNGEIDKNYLQVIVSNEDLSSNNVFGHLFYTPSREIYPGTEVIFSNRLKLSDMVIDYGDGSECETILSESRHVYGSSGLYTVSVSGKGKNGEPGCIKLRLVVK